MSKGIFLIPAKINIFIKTLITKGEVIKLKISTKGRYSLRMMLDLAEHYNEGFIALKDISARQDISKKYLEQIIPFLNRNSLLKANKGHMGGYQLAKHPSEITVREILESAEGSLTPVSCMDESPNLCEQRADCMTLPVYEGLYKVITEYLDGITLQDILDNHTTECEYYI
jgi:Rrf2 family protein